MLRRRRHFLVNKPLQFRYMAFITVTLLSISVISLVSLYIGIWASVLDSFSNEQIRNDLLIASRLTQYEEARQITRSSGFSTLSFFKQSEKLSQRQREVFKRILDTTNRELFFKLLLLFILIAWGSIYLSHRIAGPLYRFQITLEEIAGGNMTTRIHLRTTDEAQFLATQFNSTTLYLDQLFSKVKNIARENADNPDRLVKRLDEELQKIRTSADR